MEGRRKSDYYEIHALAITELIKRVGRIGGTILDCYARTGEFAIPLRTFYPREQILTNNPDHHQVAGSHFNPARLNEWEELAADWIITKPPRYEQFKITVNAYDRAAKGLAVFVPLSFLEPTYERQHWLTDHPPSKLIVLPRYLYSPDGKIDSITSCWVVWEKDRPWETYHAIQIVTK